MILSLCKTKFRTNNKISILFMSMLLWWSGVTQFSEQWTNKFDLQFINI